MVEQMNDDIEKWRSQQIYKKLTDARQIIADRDAQITERDKRIGELQRYQEHATFQEYELKARIGGLEAQVAVMRSVLVGYEDWEADLIMDNGCWEPEGTATYPKMTAKIYEDMMRLQEMRNKALLEGGGE